MSFGLFLTLLLACCGYALWRGGPPERVAAGLQLAAFVVGLPLHSSSAAGRFAAPLIGGMTIDLVLFGALAVLAHRSTRYWPFLLAGWQLAAMTAHVAKLINPDMLALGYAFQTEVWAYPMLAVTAAGTWRYRERLIVGDRQPDWQGAAA